MLLAMIVFWRKKWRPTAVFLPGKSHGQRSLAGYSPWVCKESDTTERDCTSLFCTTDSLHTQNLTYSECSNIVQAD